MPHLRIGLQVVKGVANSPVVLKRGVEVIREAVQEDKLVVWSMLNLQDSRMLGYAGQPIGIVWVDAAGAG